MHIHLKQWFGGSNQPATVWRPRNPRRLHHPADDYLASGNIVRYPRRRKPPGRAHNPSPGISTAALIIARDRLQYGSH